MGTNVHLTPELERFARERVEQGRYNNVSEVIREALRLLQDQERGRLAAERAFVEAELKAREDRRRREAAFREMKQRWADRPAIDIGPWSRDELYD
jgi:antitoxin ParD1/3/4